MKWGEWLGWGMRAWCVFLGGVTLFLAAPFVACLLGGQASDGIVLATGLIILFYTIETQGMRREMVRQNEIAIRPLVVSTIEKRPSGPSYADYVVLRNVGRGVALMVRVQDLHIQDAHLGRLIVKFSQIDFLEAGDGKIVFPDITLEGVKHERMDFIRSLMPELSQDPYDVVISYVDVDDREHQSVMRMGKGGVRLLPHGRTRRS